MKSLELHYSGTFPYTPVSGWTRRQFGYFKSPRGRFPRQEDWVPNPFFTSRKRWCALEVHLDGITLWFATPEELDHVRGVLAGKVLQSTRVPGDSRRVGRPNRHWLSRLPAKAKTPKFRHRFEKLVTSGTPEMAAFRQFYRDEDHP